MYKVFSVVLAGLFLTACATTRDPKVSLAESQKPAWALDNSQRDMIVAVSPARQTLQLLGSSGAIIGLGISAISNAKYRRAIEEVLEDYDARQVFEDRVAERLEPVMGAHAVRVEPLGSAPGYQAKRDAERARLRSLRGQGHDSLLDLKMTYGLFGYEGTLITKLDAVLLELPKGKRLWAESLVVSSEDILASDRLSDPTKRLGPNFSALRLTIGENAIEKWTGDGGATLRARYEAAVDGVVSALLTGMGLADETKGHYYLGHQAMHQKKFEKADAHFKRALELDPADIAARNGLSVNLAHNGQVQDAIKVAKEIIESAPDYAPAYYNLAWWLSIEKKDPEAAKPYYEKALELGFPEDKKIEKALQ
jgi:tetratricopeptide (TPR) repeat protein